MNTIRQHPFDAVLLIAFGGPAQPDDIRPFLDNVLRGRNVPQARVDEVVRHYEGFGGVSPITELTRRQARGLAERLARDSARVPVFVGMRNWHPFLADTLLEMSRAGIRRALGFIMAAHRSYSSCEQYREDIDAARRHLRERGRADVQVTYVGNWHAHPEFVSTVAAQIRVARLRLPPALRPQARVVFTAHSIPASMAARSCYEAQLRESCRAVAQTLAIDDWTLVYQSRSGRPQDPWLEPDVCAYLPAEHRRGLAAAILCPIGFVADHIEVLYDLDDEAATVCRTIGLPMARAATVNDEPGFLDMMADVVHTTFNRYRASIPLALVPAPTDG